jgi:putative FmdB family regulatory protein
MPTYDYHCETCELNFELEQAFSEDTLVKCPTKKSGRSPEGCQKSGRGKVTKVFRD